MNTTDAAYHAVHDYPGGSESLGPRVGISPAVLRNKVNPNNETHHLTFAEAQRVVDITDDERMLRAWAHSRGLLLIKAPDGDHSASDMSVLEAVVETGVAHGQFMQSIHTALADGKVDTKEIEDINQAKRVLQTVAEGVSQRLQGMAE